eukprot:2312110-Prymnesium_polylepis.1
MWGRGPRRDRSRGGCARVEHRVLIGGDLVLIDALLHVLQDPLDLLHRASLQLLPAIFEQDRLLLRHGPDPVGGGGAAATR